MDIMVNGQRLIAQIHGAKLKYRKMTPQSQSRIKAMQIELCIPVTDQIKKETDERIVRIMDYGRGEADEPREFEPIKLEVAKQVPAGVKIYSSELLDKKTRPHLAFGFDDDITYLSLKKYVCKDGVWFLHMLIDTPYAEAVWLWLGKTWIEGSLAFEAVPVQAELDMAQDDLPLDEEK